MSKAAALVEQLDDEPGDGVDGLVIGRIVEVTPEGVVRVDYPGNEAGPLAASALSSLDVRRGCSAEAAAVIGFDRARADRPVVLGFLSDDVGASSEAAGSRGPGSEDSPRIAESDEQITISCGKSSIVLKRDGTIVLKGKKIVSRASEANRIKGASVFIN